MRSITRAIVVFVLAVTATITVSTGSQARCVTAGADSISQTICGLP